VDLEEIGLRIEDILNLEETSRPGGWRSKMLGCPFVSVTFAVP
jgi:hypothetical protein